MVRFIADPAVAQLVERGNKGVYVLISPEVAGPIPASSSVASHNAQEGSRVKDYNLTVTVRNNFLLTKMREKGLYTVAELARAVGIQQTSIYPYMNLRQAPMWRHGRWSTVVQKLAAFFSCLPEDLFPPQHIEKCLPKNKAELTVDLADVSWLLEGPERMALPPDERIAAKEVSTAISAALNQLTARQIQVLKLRFGLDGEGERTLREVGEIIGVSRSRVAGIEHCALRVLRAHPQAVRIKVATGEITDKQCRTFEADRSKRKLRKYA